jgi:hypothetical protein
MNKSDILQIWKDKIHVVRVKGLQYDIDSVRQWFKTSVLPLPPAWQQGYDIETNSAKTIPIEESGKKGFGGWTVIGTNKSYTSAWLPNGHLPHWNLDIPQDFSKATVRTDICTGAMAEFIDDLEKNGIFISRARITITKPGIGLKYHTDSNYPGELIVRLQFPIISNSNTFFHSETHRWNLKDSGGVYLLNTNHLHKVENDGDDIRFNLIADVDVDRLPDHDMYDLVEGEEFPGK